MEELTSLEALTNRLSGVDGRIGIDGIDGVRKTSIANYLSQIIRLDSVHVDDFIVKNRGGYLDFVRYEKLREALLERRRCIVEGVCLLQVLERIEIDIDVLVYIKRYHLGLWADERELSVETENVESFLAKERECAAILSGEADDGGPSLADDIVRYHSRFRPQKLAQLIYRWDDN